MKQATRPFAVFYHIWCPPQSAGWRIIVDEQLKRIFRSGLPNVAEIYCCISGAEHHAIADYVASYPWVQILQSNSDESAYEGLTLKCLYDFCREMEGLDGVCYMHTKGISHFSTCTHQMFRALNSWRHFLEWGVIDRWRDAVVHLATHDAVGVHYCERPWPHFSGNFWWATPSYIRRLSSPEAGNFPPLDEAHDGPISLSRINFERWVGLQRPRVFSFYNYPFRAGGIALEINNLYEHDIEPYYRANSS